MAPPLPLDMSSTLAPHPAAPLYPELLPSSSDQDLILSLPHELWVDICKHVSPTDLSRLLCCSRIMYALRFEPRLQPTLEAAELLRQHGARRVLFAALECADRDKQPVALVRALLNEPMVVEAVRRSAWYGCNSLVQCLNKACRVGLHDIASFLLDAPGVVDGYIDEYIDGALHALCRVQGVDRNTQHANLKRLLGMQVVDVNAVEIHTSYTALHIACEAGYVEAVALLLAHPEINVNSTSWITPLTLACKAGHVECVQLLLHHPDVDVFASVGDMHTTAREVALQRGHHAIARLLDAAETRVRRWQHDHSGS